MKIGSINTTVAFTVTIAFSVTSLFVSTITVNSIMRSNAGGRVGLGELKKLV